MGACHSSPKFKNNGPFSYQHKLEISNPFKRKSSDTNSVTPQIFSKKEIFISTKLIQQKEIGSPDNLNIGIEGNIRNIPHLFDKKTEPKIKLKEKSPFLESSLFKKNANFNLIQKQLPKTQVIQDYFQPEFCNKIFNEVLNENLKEYNNYECILKDIKSPLKIQIYLLPHKKQESNKINKFRTEFIAPCSAKQYCDIANDLKLQKILDTYCDEYKVLESLPNLRLLYLSYQKTIFSSPRDFVYVKIVRSFQLNGKEYWGDAASSIVSNSYPPLKNVIRCQIIKSGHLIEDLSTKQEKKCLVKIFSECDFKMDLPLFFIRNFSSNEMKKFVEKTIKKVREVCEFKKI